jgi:hypothetical protein
MPPQPIAVRLLEEGTFPRSAASALVNGFNRRMLAHRGPYWCVAVPIQVRYVGDAQPGKVITCVLTTQDLSPPEST